MTGMRRPFRFLVVLIIGLGLVTWAASVAVRETTRDWFEKDVRLRAQLAVSGARSALIAHWSRDERGELEGLLSEITHDERIMAAAACTSDFRLLTRTADYPSSLGCAEIGKHLAWDSAGGKTWQTVLTQPGGTSPCQRCACRRSRSASRFSSY